MFHPADCRLIEAHQVKIRGGITSARLARLARRPPLNSVPRGLGRQAMQIGASLAAVPSLGPACTT
jgi:hypothetical protein